MEVLALADGCVISKQLAYHKYPNVFSKGLFTVASLLGALLFCGENPSVPADYRLAGHYVCKLVDGCRGRAHSGKLILRIAAQINNIEQKCS